MKVARVSVENLPDRLGEDITPAGCVAIYPDNIILHFLKLHVFFCCLNLFLTLRFVHVMQSYILSLIYRSTHVQDVILGLLRNCWKKEGVFYYNAVMSIFAALFHVLFVFV